MSPTERVLDPSSTTSDLVTGFLAGLERSGGTSLTLVTVCRQTIEGHLRLIAQLLALDRKERIPHGELLAMRTSLQTRLGSLAECERTASEFAHLTNQFVAKVKETINV